MPTTSNATVICPILVGRDAEVASLRMLLDQARQGRGQAALISGEAGIGKSRLVATVKAAARSAEMPVIEGRCFEHDRAIPYALLISMLRASFAGDAAPRQPEAAPLLRELTAQHEAAHAATDPEQRKRRLFQSLAQLALGGLEHGRRCC
jgi:predicted ATPase